MAWAGSIGVNIWTGFKLLRRYGGHFESQGIEGRPGGKGYWRRTATLLTLAHLKAILQEKN